MSSSKISHTYYMLNIISKNIHTFTVEHLNPI